MNYLPESHVSPARSANESYEAAKKRFGIVTSPPIIEAKPVAKKAGSKPSKKPVKNPFKGHWRITWMDQWDQDFVDEEVEGFFEFDAKNTGSFQFGYVRGQIDYRMDSKDGTPCLEFSWEGNDEMDPAQGNGWAVVAGNELTGMIFFHQGDESEFKASRKRSR